jgi:hypothetical protein
MKHCPDCERLSRNPHAIGIPSNLIRIATLRSDSAVTFRYECRHCEARWDCIPGKGWRPDAPTTAMTTTTPLLRRLAAVARSGLSRLQA